MPELDFEAGRTAILGLGREGRAAWRYLRARYPELPLDLVDEGQPDAGFVAGLGPRDRLVTGPLEQAGLDAYDILVRSPGISLYREPIRRAVAAGARVTSPSSLWFAAHPEARTICVTGTKGKSTSSALLAQLLRAAGHRVRLAGNIGKALLECELEADPNEVDWWVIELSSYQLADLEARPTLGVILNLSPEHLGWHGGEAAYRRDKLRLAELVGAGPLVVNAADRGLAAEFAGRGNVAWFNRPGGLRAAQDRLWDGEAALDVTLPAGLPGAHNLSNLAAVLTALRCIGIDPATVLGAVADFRPLPHRLQLLGERAGRRYVNDSISSTPVATAAALECYAGQAVVLIVGGLDRGLDWSPYMTTFAARAPRAVIAVPDNGPGILQALRDAGIRPAGGLHECAGLADAAALAAELAPPGGVVLLSPGAPSFPHFRDYRDRGRRFAALCGFELDDWDPF